jgi:hypothetical protein
MTPAAAPLDRLLDIVVTTEPDQPGRISLASSWQCSLWRSASCLPLWSCDDRRRTRARN